jgi:hypothetical protein
VTTPGGDAGRAAQERLAAEARATASALLDWLGARVEAPPAGGAASPPSGSRRLGMRPPQSPGPCSWCPVCALVAALRGEQPELTARLAEQASGLMMLLRLMVQSHQDPGHGHHHAPAADAPDPGGTPPAGWPAEWGAWDGWGAAPPAPAAPEAPEEEDLPEPEPRPAPERPRRAPASPADGASRRRVPIRRASPRSAAFRDSTPTTGTPTAGTPTPSAPAAPGGPAPRPAGPRPAPRRASAHDVPADAPAPATPTGPAPTGPAESTARPSVQRIAIRRPPRGDGPAPGGPGAPC